MIRIVWGAEDVRRTRFVLSPLAEVAESLFVIASSRRPAALGWWWRAVPDRLAGHDLSLLRAVVPYRRAMAAFLFGCLGRARIEVADQLHWLAELPVEQLVADVEEVWDEDPVPVVLARTLDGPDPAQRLATAVASYWQAALAPDWPRIRGVLEEDLAHRAAVLADSGIEAMFAGLHERIAVDGSAILAGEGPVVAEIIPEDGGLMLVPSVFAYPLLAVNAAPETCIVYGPRGLGRLSESDDLDAVKGGGLATLLGRTRALVLFGCHLPTTTTELAARLGVSPASVSEHLGVLRASELLTSWRSGRRVLYARTPLGDSIIAAQQQGTGWRSTPG